MSHPGVLPTCCLAHTVHEFQHQALLLSLVANACLQLDALKTIQYFIQYKLQQTVKARRYAPFKENPNLAGGDALLTLHITVRAPRLPVRPGRPLR